MFPALATAAAAVTRHGAVRSLCRQRRAGSQAGKHWSGSTGRGGTAAPHAEIKRGGGGLLADSFPAQPMCVVRAA